MAEGKFQSKGKLGNKFFPKAGIQTLLQTGTCSPVDGRVNLLDCFGPEFIQSQLANEIKKKTNGPGASIRKPTAEVTLEIKFAGK